MLNWQEYPSDLTPFWIYPILSNSPLQHTPIIQQGKISTVYTLDLNYLKS